MIDYQNIHKTGHELWGGNKLDIWETLVDPLLFATRLISVRNREQRDFASQRGTVAVPAASLLKVLVFRGQVDSLNEPTMFGRSQRQERQWGRDARVEVHFRPLRYEYERDAAGNPIHDVHGRRVWTEKREKGIDVLCALAVVREARDPMCGLVILASHDSDLAPALSEAMSGGRAKIETTSWYQPGQRPQQCFPDNGKRVWNTRLRREDFFAATDPTDYL